jgi:uncharacterized protein (TIGR00369 family)
MEFQDDNYCFACGKDNPIGLKLKFSFNGEDSTSITFIPNKEHQGWANVVHGGILSSLMDEIMARLIINNIGNVVTSRMDTRFLRPAKVGEELTITGKIEKDEAKFVKASSRIVNSAGKCIAASTGFFAKI